MVTSGCARTLSGLGGHSAQRVRRTCFFLSSFCSFLLSGGLLPPPFENPPPPPPGYAPPPRLCAFIIASRCGAGALGKRGAGFLVGCEIRGFAPGLAAARLVEPAAAAQLARTAAVAVPAAAAAAASAAASSGRAHNNSGQKARWAKMGRGEWRNAPPPGNAAQPGHTAAEPAPWRQTVRALAGAWRRVRFPSARWPAQIAKKVRTFLPHPLSYTIVEYTIC